MIVLILSKGYTILHSELLYVIINNNKNNGFVQ